MALKMWYEEGCVTRAYMLEAIGDVSQLVSAQGGMTELDRLNAFGYYHRSKMAAPFPPEPDKW